MADTPPSSNAPSDPTPSSQPRSGSASRLRRWVRRLAWTIAGLVGALLLLLGALLLVLQTETGATAAARFLASQVNPMPGTEISIERASGSWIRSLRLTNVSLVRTDSASGRTLQMAHVDTVAAEYRLGALLDNRLHLTDVSVAGPSVTMRQAPDSTWDWMRHLPATEEDTSEGMAVQVDRARLVRGDLTAEYYAEGRDSTAQLQDLRLLARDLQTAPTYTGRLDTLGLRGRLPADTTSLRMAARGALTRTHLQLETFQLDSPRSRVRGVGRARRPEHWDTSLDDVDLTLRADPLALQDLAPLAPTLDLNPQETLRLDAEVTGSGQRLTATVDASVNTGGTLTARAEVIPRSDTAAATPPSRYRLEAHLQRLTTSLLGPADTTQNQVTADLEADLAGRELAALDGSGEVSLEDTRLYGLHIPNLSLASTLREGEASVDLQGTVNTAGIAVDGHARPFDAAPSTSMTVRVRNFNAAAFMEEGDLETDLSATAQIDGRALGTPESDLMATIDLERSQVGIQPINDGQLSVDLASDQVQFDAGLTLPAGRMEAAGFVALDGSERFALNTGRLDNLNVAALAGDTTESRVTGTFQSQGQGFDPETMQLDATLSLRDSQYGPHQLSTLRATARLEDGHLATETSAQLNGGSWTVAAEGQPFASVPTAEITQGRFQQVDIGPFLQDTTQSSQLHGHLQGSLRGATPATMELDAGITLDTSRINQQRIRSASLDLHLREAQVDTELALDMPNGSSRFVATARPFDEVPTYQVTEGSFENVDVGAIAGVQALTTRLTGGLTLSGRGASPSTLSLTSELTFQPSTINQASLSDGRLALTADRGQASAEGQFDVAGGSIRMEGRADSLTSTPVYSLETSAGSLDASALAGMDTLTARVDTLEWTVDGRGTDLESMTATTQLWAGPLHLDRFRIHTATLGGTLREGVLALDTLTVQSNAFVSRGSGSLALVNNAGTSNFRLQTNVTDAGPLRRLAGAQTLQLGSASFEVRVYGTTERQRFDGIAEADGLIYDDLHLTDAELKFNGERGTEQLFQRLEVDGTLGYLSMPGLAAEQTRLRALYDGTSVDLSTKVTLDQQRNADLEATIRPGEEETVATLRRVNLRLGPDRWSLLQEATITVGANYRIDGLLLYSDSQQIAADGVIDPTGTQSLVVTVENFRLGGVAPLMGLSGLDGRLTGTLDLTGAASDPQLVGHLDLDLQSENQDVGTLLLDVDYDDLALAIDARLTHTDGGILTASGSIPSDLRLQVPTPGNVYDRPVQLDVETESFPVNWIDPFLDPSTARDVAGTLAADVQIRGTLDDPDLSGSASLAGAGVYLPAVETRYQNGSISLSLARDQLTLETATLRSINGGHLRASGIIQFPQLTVGEFDIDLEASNFLAIDTRAYRRGIINSTMTLRGTTQRPILEGAVQIQSANIYFTEAMAEAGTEAETVALTDEDRLTLEERFGLRLTEDDTTAYDAYEALAMDLTVEIQRDTWLRSQGTPEMNVQLTGDLDLTKESQGDLQLFGTIQVVEGRSTLRQFGQEFQITEGNLTFNGDPTTPNLAIEAVYEQRARGAQGSEVRITLSLEGRPDELTPSLSSEPPMDTRNILSYLATGRPADEVFGGRSGGGNLATQVALGQATNLVENLAASELGLDVVRLQIRTEGLSYLTLGRYITPRFFVSIEQPVMTSSLQGSAQTTALIPDLTLEYHLTDYLLLRSLNSQQSFQLNLLFEYSY